MSHVAPSVAQEDDAKSTAWRYAVAGARDLRIDFMRGIALVMMVVAHTEVMSVFNIFSWERFGLTTGAEGFVILSGFMLGMLNRARLQKVVLLTVSWGLYLRAWKIYRVNIIIIVSFILLAYIPHINVFEVTHFTDRFSGESWSLLVFHIFLPRLNTSIFMAMTNSINCIITVKLISKLISIREVVSCSFARCATSSSWPKSSICTGPPSV